MNVERNRPLILEIAGIGLEIRSSDPSIPMAVGPPHVPFLAEAPGKDCALVVLGPSSERAVRRSGGRPVFDTGCIWRIEETGEGHLLTLRSPRFGRDPYLSVEFDREYSQGEGETLPGGPHLDQGMIHPFVSPFDEVVFLARLARGRGVLVHGCGVTYQGRGILFLGTSGSGKTTIAGFWKNLPGAVVLSDERIVIRKEPGEYRIFGTPWNAGGGSAAPASAPLESIFILEQAPRTILADISSSSAVAQMMVRAFPAMWDQEGLEFAVRFLAQLSEQVPVRRLQFLPDVSAVECVLADLTSGEAAREGTR